MKKIVTLSIVVLLALNVSAQFTKGNKVLGLGLNFSSSTTKRQDNNLTQITKEQLSNLSLELGFATRQNLIMGFYLNGGLGSSENEYGNPTSTVFKSKLYNAGGGVFVRSYKKIGGDFFIFGDIRAGINSAETKNVISEFVEYRRLGLSAGIYPGLAYKWKNNFLLELRFADLLSINYAEQRSYMGITAIESKNFNVGSSLGLGYLSNISIGARWIIK